MPFNSTLAGEVSDLDPAKTTPDDIIFICAMAKRRLDQMGDYGVPLSDMETIAERIRNEVETIEALVQRPEIRAGWHSEGHAVDILRRFDELEREAYNAFLAGLENLQEDNPLRHLAAQYQDLLRRKQAGEIPGLTQF